MTRRQLLSAFAAVAQPRQNVIMTVRGPVSPGELGLMLPHEHVMSNFGGDAAEPATYDERKLLATVVPYLKSLRAKGCRSLADCTTAYFGRRVDLLARISKESGVAILTNTGYYGTANDRYVPAHARTETADQIARRWVSEWKDGIGGTGIRPGFIKLGVDPGPLSGIDRKLIQAGARTHLETGLVMAVHTGDNAGAAREQLALLRSEGVSPSAWIWVHAHACKDEAALAEAATAGGWTSFDGLGSATVDRHLALVNGMKRRKLLGRVLLSHDGNSFRYGGSEPRPYEALFTEFLPGLRQAGYLPSEITALTVRNPANAFTTGVRKG